MNYDANTFVPVRRIPHSLREWLSQHLDEMVISANLNLVGGTDLFRLTRSETASAVYEKLGRAGILVRAFDDRQDWLRFGLPGSEAEFIRLEEALNR